MDWQPIETAPKDGTKILIWDGTECAVCWFEINNVWVSRNGAWISDLNRSDTYEYQATHWMPLPPPPKGMKMSDIIDLNKARNEREKPDADFIRLDEYGRELYCYMGEYDFDGSIYSVEIWAYTAQEAEARFNAMGNVRYRGMVYSAIKA